MVDGRPYGNAEDSSLGEEDGLDKWNPLCVRGEAREDDDDDDDNRRLDLASVMVVDCAGGAWNA